MKLGDMVYVKITLINDKCGWVDNIALVDCFLAGWEVENF